MRTALIAVFSLAVMSAQAQAQGVRVVGQTGGVEIQRGGVWMQSRVGDVVNTGDRVRTTMGSSAAVEVGPNKVITLNASSEVQLRDSKGSPFVQLENGSMKVFSATDIQVAAKDTVLQSAERPLDMEVGYQADQLNLTVFNGAVKNGPMIVHGTEDAKNRNYSAGRTSPQVQNGYVVANPTLYVYPYFLYGNPGRDPNAGRIVPPVVNNPTNPGYRPTQVVPPMSDPIRVPVTPRR